MKLLNEDIYNIVYKVYKKKHPLLAEIILNWQKIVGLKYSDNSFPLKITNVRRKKERINILSVEVDDSALAMEMAFRQDIIIERTAVYLGYKGIHKIRTIIRG